MENEKLFITFHEKEDILRFVAVCGRYDDAIDIRVGKQTTDAKSIMGMLLLQLDQSLEIEYGCYDDENNYDDFRNEILKEFDIRIADAGNGK